ncbi:MAG: tripartite tricarboxylate transporter substrate binding protein [Proteobacteria bacterium]|nr:tripartite tricarboxylate transporter substrate binding protein [Pseudomonadota bacterium]
MRCAALLGLLVGVIVGAPDAAAQSAYPNRPIKIMVGFPPGTAADVSTRLIGPKLGEVLNQSIVIENKPGASSNIAVEAVVHAPADGYTLFMGTISNTINPALLRDLPFDYTRDLTPVALLSTMPNFLVVHPSVPATSVAELVALAKARPGELTYGSAGTGTILHLSGELFNAMAGIKLLHVPYKGSSPAIADLLGGQIATMFAPVSTALSHVKAGTVRGLATTGGQRSAVAPELATMIELGFAGFETGVWCGLMAPTATPRDVIDRLAAAVDRAQSASEVKTLFAAQGIDLLPGGPDVLGRYIRTETEKWGRVIEMSGARND